MIPVSQSRHRIKYICIRHILFRLTSAYSKSIYSLIEKLLSDLWHYFSGLSSKTALTKPAFIGYYSNILAHKNLPNLRTASNCDGSGKAE